MNLVQQITDQFSDDTLSKLGAQLGTDPETASSAATAAVPALLSALSGMASRPEGARKLTDMLGGIDSSSFGNFAQLLGGDTGSLLQRGGGLLSSMFGDGMIGGIASAISRYSGMNTDTVKRMLAFLAPLVLGKVASAWRSQGGTTGALTSLFADQKRNIADAVPAGFALNDIPGMSSLSEATRATANTARRGAETAEATAGSVASWLLPVAVLLLGAFLLWNFLKPRDEAQQPVAVDRTANEGAKTTVLKPVVPDNTTVAPNAAIPDAAAMTTQLRDTLASLSTELDGIRDAASAEAALPKLEQFKSRLDTMHQMRDRLPAASMLTMREAIESQMGTLTQKTDTILQIPSLSDRVKTLIGQIVQMLTELAAPSQPAQAAATQ